MRWAASTSSTLLYWRNRSKDWLIHWQQLTADHTAAVTSDFQRKYCRVESGHFCTINLMRTRTERAIPVNPGLLSSPTVRPIALQEILSSHILLLAWNGTACLTYSSKNKAIIPHALQSLRWQDRPFPKQHTAIAGWRERVGGLRVRYTGVWKGIKWQEFGVLCCEKLLWIQQEVLPILIVLEATFIVEQINRTQWTDRTSELLLNWKTILCFVEGKKHQWYNIMHQCWLHKTLQVQSIKFKCCLLSTKCCCKCLSVPVYFYWLKNVLVWCWDFTSH